MRIKCIHLSAMFDPAMNHLFLGGFFHSTRTGTTPTLGGPSTDIQALLPYIIGGAVLVALLFVVLFVCVLRRRKRDRHRGWCLISMVTFNSFVALDIN